MLKSLNVKLRPSQIVNIIHIIYNVSKVLNKLKQNNFAFLLNLDMYVSRLYKLTLG